MTRLVSILAGAALIVGLAASQAASSDRTTLHGSAPAWANSRNLAGNADPAAAVGFRVYLGWKDGAEALARAVSDPHSNSYGQYLTAPQFRQRFAPSQAQVGAVQSWLRGQGFTIDYTPANNHYVAAEGTVAQANAAFGTTLRMYHVRGKTLRSPDGDVSVPSSLASVVTGVLGLDEGAVFVRPDQARPQASPSPGFRNAPPLSAYWAELFSPYAFPAGFQDVSLPSVPWSIRGHTPAQIKGAYGISSAYNGAGQTVAVIDAYASPTILQDVNEWSTRRGLPTMTGSQFTQIVAPGTYHRPQNPAQDPQGWYGEETLDVEAVHGMAPAANIVYIGAPNNYQDLDAAMNHVVDRHLAQIVTNSYGFATTELLPPGYVKPLEETLIQAAAEGIGVYFSSGDTGDETATFGFATTDWPASSPWVTAVGGTSLGVTASNTRALETGWGTSNYNCDTTTLACTRTGWLYGSGGGVSVVFPKPWYQSGLNLSGRGVPDVAAVGDPNTGFLVGQTQAFPDGDYYDEYRLGGTSLSSPLFAGLMALADQKCNCVHGFANPAFYAHTGAFTDILSVKTAVARRNYVNNVDASDGTVDRLRTFDDYTGSPTQHTGPGWDNVTGLGVPNGIFGP
jgi:subtilase family serine protease